MFLHCIQVRIANIKILVIGLIGYYSALQKKQQLPLEVMDIVVSIDIMV